MTADVLATLGARASAAMVLTYVSCNIPAPSPCNFFYLINLRKCVLMYRRLPPTPNPQPQPPLNPHPPPNPPTPNPQPPIPNPDKPQ